jgi:hypothetical protein
VLGQAGEWRGVPEVVRLALETVASVLKLHESRLEQASTFVTQNEFNSQLSLKANNKDVTRWITELELASKNKIDHSEVENMLTHYATQADLKKEMLTLQRSNDMLDIRGRIEMQIEKSAEKAVESRLEQISRGKTPEPEQVRSEELQREIKKANSSELKSMQHALQSKFVSVQAFNEALESKASKQSMVISLQKKVNKAEFEEFMSKTSADI